MSMLPKIKQLKTQEKEVKPVEVYRKSLSKGKPKAEIRSGAANNLTSVIADSRSYLESAENSSRKGKRPSLHKKGSSSDLNTSKQERLPELKPIKTKKLELLGANKSPKETNFETKDVMYTTAPHFHKAESKPTFIKDKSKSKEKANQSYFQEDPAVVKKSSADDMIMVKTQQGFYEKEPKMHHRPIIKRVSTGDKPKERTEDVVVEQSLQEQPKAKEPARESKRL
jgi:hypothetical protein